MIRPDSLYSGILFLSGLAWKTCFQCCKSQFQSSLNFKLVVSHTEEETMLLSVFYYFICTFLCCCHCFNPSLCHFLPFLLSCVAVSRPCPLSEF